VAAVRDGGGGRHARDAGYDMSVFGAGWRRLRRILGRNPAGEIDAELTFHFEERIAALMAEGRTLAEARTRAASEFGDVESVRAGLVMIDRRIAEQETHREWWDGVRGDVRYVFRSLGRSPGFVIAVALTLALGLGANAAIFSLLDRLFLRPQPGVVHPADIHRIYEYQPPKPGEPPPSAAHPRQYVQAVFTYSHYRELRSAIPAGIPLAGYYTGTAAYGAGDQAPRLAETYVIGDYFSLLGARPAAGRFFAPEELRVETPLALVVISARLWKRQFGASPEAVGQRIEIDGHRYVIIGVAATPFHGPDNDAVDLWVPLNTLYGFQSTQSPWYESTHSFNIRLLFRAATATELAAATQGAATVFRHGSVFPDSLADARIGGVVEPVMPGFDQSSVNIATRLAGVSLIILLIACANVGNLFLTRGMRRRKEIAVRLSLGVTRRRLMRLLLLEALVLALAAAVIALGVAVWGATTLRHLLLPDTQWADGPIDVRMIGFAIVLAVVAGVGASLFPAIQSCRPDLVVALKAGAREGGHQRSRLRTGMLIAQAAFSVVLLAGAGLFVRSLRSVETENIGYDGDRLIFADVSWNQELSDHAVDVAARFPDYLAQLRRLPGVEAVAYNNQAPFRGMQFMEFHLPGRDSVPRAATNVTTTQPVSPEYFRAVGVRVLGGRRFVDGDGPGTPPVIIVSHTVARVFWPGQNALGQCVIVGSQDAPCREVVGIVSDVHMHDIIEDESPMQMYIPKAQDAQPNQGTVIVRAQPGTVARLMPLMRKMVIATYGDWALPRVHAMSEYLDQQLRSWRLGAILFSAAGLLALVVSLVGIYSTISSIFSQRAHEIGVRIALGAVAGNIVRLVLGEGVRVVTIGVVIGVALSLAAGRLVAALLYHTSPRDPTVLAGAAVSLLLVAVCACVVPAWRALRVDPATALRAE
jgi:predicted permease